jgi:hypothetical protein
MFRRGTSLRGGTSKRSEYAEGSAAAGRREQAGYLVASAAVVHATLGSAKRAALGSAVAGIIAAAWNAEAVKREGVSSSAIRSLGYAPKTKTLEVAFRRGAVYQYHGVPAKRASALKHASSIGRHFVRKVRDEYSFSKVRAGHGRRKRGR